MQTASSVTWTRILVSNSYDDNHYTKSAAKINDNGAGNLNTP